MVTLPYTQPTYLPIQPRHTCLQVYLPSNLSISTSPVTYLPINIPTYLPSTYLHTYLPTNAYISLVGLFLSYPILPFLVPIEVLFGMSCSLFRYPLKSVSVPIEVRFAIFIGPFWSVSVSSDTAKNYLKILFVSFVELGRCILVN